MHLSLPLFNFTQWKDKCESLSFTTKKLTHSMCQVSLVVKYDSKRKHILSLSLKKVLVLENSADPDGLPHYGYSLFVGKVPV